MRKAFAGWIMMTLALAAVPAVAQDVDPVPAPASEARVPNYLGSTGLLLTPSAYVQRSGSFSAHLNGNSNFAAGGLLGGFGDRLEIGATFLDADEDFAGGDTEFLLNAKLRLTDETDSAPAFSVGVVDLLDELNQDPSWFVVASKYFTRGDVDQPFALKGHLGFGGGIYDEELFGGLELFFTENLSLLGEVANGDFNIGGRWTSRGFTATVSLFDWDHFGAGISYTGTFR